MDVGIVDVIWNGFLESMKIASMAEAYEVNVAPHNFYGHLADHISAHFAAAVPNLRIMEMDIDDVPQLMRASPTPAHLEQPTSPAIKTSTDRDKSKHYQCLYPVYFDKTRSRAEGRRVGRALAVDSPLAREMADAAANLGLRTVFEPDKTHPKDWANPGRVRVLLKHEGKPVDAAVKNKHHLYILVSQYLQTNPTQKNTPFRLPIAGLPMPTEMPEPAIPKGWKMSKILPLHSPALTGGGVSENFLQDMMAEMGGLEGAVGASSGSDTKKKIKDRKKK